MRISYSKSVDKDMKRSGFDQVSFHYSECIFLWLLMYCLHIDLFSVQTCMMGLIQDQVWLGSLDSVIYIIDTNSMSCNKQLTEHRHEVTGLSVDTKEQNNRCKLDNSWPVDISIKTVLVKSHYLVSWSTFSLCSFSIF